MSPRKGLREITVHCPAWSDDPIIMREPSVRVWRDAQKETLDQDRTIAILAAIVLGQDGKPVGVEPILDAPLAALGQLAIHVPGLLGEGTSDVPLTPQTASTTGLPSPSVE